MVGRAALPPAMGSQGLGGRTRIASAAALAPSMDALRAGQADAPALQAPRPVHARWGGGDVTGCPAGATTGAVARQGGQPGRGRAGAADDGQSWWPSTRDSVAPCGRRSGW